MHKGEIVIYDAHDVCRELVRAHYPADVREMVKLSMCGYPIDDRIGTSCLGAGGVYSSTSKYMVTCLSANVYGRSIVIMPNGNVVSECAPGPYSTCKPSLTLAHAAHVHVIALDRDCTKIRVYGLDHSDTIGVDHDTIVQTTIAQDASDRQFMLYMPSRLASLVMDMETGRCVNSVSNTNFSATWSADYSMILTINTRHVNIYDTRSSAVASRIQLDRPCFSGFVKCQFDNNHVMVKQLADMSNIFIDLQTMRMLSCERVNDQTYDEESDKKMIYKYRILPNASMSILRMSIGRKQSNRFMLHHAIGKCPPNTGHYHGLDWRSYP